MGWESRKGTKQLYYIRKVTVSGRKQRQYMGHGPEAELAAEQDAQRHANREAIWSLARTNKTELLAAAMPLRELATNLDLLIKATLLTNGYYSIDRHWKPRHDHPTP